MEKSEVWEKVGNHYEADLSIIADLKRHNKLPKLEGKFHLPHPEGKDEWLTSSQFEYEGLRGDHEWWTYKAASGITHYLKRYRHGSKDTPLITKPYRFDYTFTKEDIEESGKLSVDQVNTLADLMAAGIKQTTIDTFTCTVANPKKLQFPQLTFP